MFKKLLSPIIILLIATLACSNMDTVPLTVATVCMNAKTDKEINLQRFFSYMDEAATQGANLIVFPEAALQQNPAWGVNYQPIQEELDYLRQSAETIPGKSTEKLAKKAKELNIYVIFGMTEKVLDKDVLYNSCVLLGPAGIIWTHRKRHLWGFELGGNEEVYWTPSNELGIFDSPFGKIGIMICGNMYYYFPEERSEPKQRSELTGPVLAEEGADLLVTVTAWPDFDVDHYEDLYEYATQGTASETKRWHIVSNQVDSVGHTICYGHSRIIDPDGNIVVDTGQKEGMVIAKTDLLIDLNFSKRD